MRTFFLLLLTLSGYQLVACSCGGYGKVSLSDVLYYDFIFEGRIVSDPKIEKGSSGFDKREFQVLVLQQYFGISSQDTITISTGLGSTDCGLDLKNGDKWLIFATSDGRVFNSSSCSNSINSKSFSYAGTKQFLLKYKSKTKYVKDRVNGYLIQGFLENGKPEGEWLITKNQDTTEIINFTHGILDGKWTKYHEQGKSRTIRNYKLGVRDGVYEYYNKDGILITRIIYSDGQKNGSSEEYYASGELYRKSEYSNGALIEDEIFEHQEEPVDNYQFESIDFSEFRRNLIQTLNKPDSKWPIPNSILISPDNKYFVIAYNFNPTFFELYETVSLKKLSEFKTRGHAYLFSSYFNDGSIFIDIGKKINIGKEKTQFMAYDISSGEMRRVKCEDSPTGCEYPIINPYRNSSLKEYITSDQQIMFKIENSVVNVYQITKD